jgi:hypothetical protein
VIKIIVLAIVVIVAIIKISSARQSIALLFCRRCR